MKRWTDLKQDLINFKSMDRCFFFQNFCWLYIVSYLIIFVIRYVAQNYYILILK